MMLIVVIAIEKFEMFIIVMVLYADIVRLATAHAFVVVYSITIISITCRDLWHLLLLL
jgi:hypothetical protein